MGINCVPWSGADQHAPLREHGEDRNAILESWLRECSPLSEALEKVIPGAILEQFLNFFRPKPTNVLQGWSKILVQHDAGPTSANNGAT